MAQTVLVSAGENVVAIGEGGAVVTIAVRVEVGPTGPAGPPTLNTATEVGMTALGVTSIYTNESASNGIPTGLVIRVSEVIGSTATAPVIVAERVSDGAVILPPTQLVGLNSAGKARVITFANTYVVSPTDAIRIEVLTASSADTFTTFVSLLGFEQAAT